MKRRLLTMLLALVAIMMPIGAWALNYTLKMPNTGITTLYVPFTLELPEGVRAYIVTDVITHEDGTVKLVEKELEGGIPGSTPVIIRGDQASYTFTIATKGFPAIEDNNLLKGTLVPMSLDVSSETGNFMLYYTHESSEYGLELADWQAPVNNGNSTYPLSANMAYLQLPVESWSSKLAALKALPHLQHTHGGCDICGQVTGVEAAWGASADALTLGGTLTQAISAAAEEGSTVRYIKLLADVESTDGYTIEGADFTLDLNGQTIASEKITLNIKSSTVTIEDNSEVKEGKVISSEDYAVSVDAGASVTINEGTYESTDFIALNVQGENSSVTINGGSYESLSQSISIFESCFVTITGGNFTSQAPHAISTFGNLFINGGNFISAKESENIVYYGGKITFSEYDGLTSITVSNGYGERIVPSAETILLPEGYSFFYSNKVVSTLANGVGYSIGVEPAKYAVTFEANGGEGEMEGDNIYEGVDYTLPKCTFTAPKGMMFKAWQIGEDEYQPGDVVTIEGETTITALWTVYVPQIVIKMHDSAGDGWHGDAIVVKKNGEEIGTATLEIEDGADGIVRYEYDNTAEYTFYWSCNHEQELEEDPDYRCYPRECSFEMFIDDEEVFAAIDCSSYVDGDLIYTIEVENLTIADGELTAYSSKLSQVGTLTYTRTLPNLKWNALYVPFEIPVSALTDKYDVAYINDIRSYDENEDGALDRMTMEIIKLSSGTLHANHPYLIRAKNEDAKNMNLVLTDATLRQTEENSFSCSSMYMNFTVTGSYNSLSAEDLEGKYAISVDGAWQLLNEGTTLKPFRLYMEMTPRVGSPVKVESAALSRIRISVQGEVDGATGIEMVDTPQRETDGTFFDLSGRKVKAPVKGGIYIRNGKKILVK